MAAFFSVFLTLGSLALGAGTWKETHSLWKSTLVTLLGWFLTFSKDVWKELKVKWVKRIADTLDDSFSEWTARYKNRYAQALYYKYRTFDVKGLSTQGKFTLNLESVYVDLSIDPAVASEIPQDPVVSASPSSGTILEWLRSDVHNHGSYAVIGPPGSGKTTLLKHLALLFSSKRRPWNLTPILLVLRDIESRIDADSKLKIDELLTEEYKDVPPPPGWFRNRLLNGHCLVMLDGLDEIADLTLRKKVVKWVEHQIEIYGNNRFLVSSRPSGYRENPIAGLSVLRVLPFSSSQVDRFITNWYVANEIAAHQRDDKGVRKEARDGALDLIARLRRSPTLRDLSVNPLLLTMIATVHLYRSALPRKRVDLYAEICDVFLGKRQEARGMELNLTPGQRIRVLRVLAHHMMCLEIAEIDEGDAIAAITETVRHVDPSGTAEMFLHMVEDSSGILCQRESGRFSFAHLTFQEYLASIHVKEEQTVGELAALVGNSWWGETTRLYCAQADASPIVESCLREDPPSPYKLMLALDCEADAFELQVELRERLQRFTEDAIEDPDPNRRSMAAGLMLTRRLRDLVCVDDLRFTDTTPISRAEYQIFVDERREAEDYRRSDHWMTPVFPPGSGLQAVTGLRVGDGKAFCDWLTERHTNGSLYRLPLATDLSAIGPLFGETYQGIPVLTQGTYRSNTSAKSSLDKVKVDMLQEAWPASPSAFLRMTSFLLWLAISRYQTEGLEIKVREAHILEFPVLITELLHERDERHVMDLKALRAGTAQAQSLVRQLLSNRRLVFALGEALEEELSYGRQLGLCAEDSLLGLRTVFSSLSASSRIGESAAYHSLDLYRFLDSISDAVPDLDAFSAELALTFSDFCSKESSARGKNEDCTLWIMKVEQKTRLVNNTTLAPRKGSEMMARFPGALEKPTVGYRPTGSLYRAFFKRVLDVVLALALFVLIVPLFVVIALLVLSTSGSPIFYLSERVGKDGQPFRMFKFRTMVVDAERLMSALEHMNERKGVLFKIKTDPRITKIGVWLRRYSLDELPQLINVLRGEMSLVGPRPATARDFQQYSAYSKKRVAVTPGLTSLWQVTGRSSVGFDTWMELDMAYIRNLSFSLDMKILLRTVPVMLRGSGAI